MGRAAVAAPSRSHFSPKSLWMPKRSDRRVRSEILSCSSGVKRTTWSQIVTPNLTVTTEVTDKCFEAVGFLPQ